MVVVAARLPCCICDTCAADWRCWPVAAGRRPLRTQERTGAQPNAAHSAPPSPLQVSSSYDIVAAQGRRCSTQNFFRGDIKSSRHQLHKASVAALRSRASGPGGLRAAYRCGRRRSGLVIT